MDLFLYPCIHTLSLMKGLIDGIMDYPSGNMFSIYDVTMSIFPHIMTAINLRVYFSFGTVLWLIKTIPGIFILPLEASVNLHDKKYSIL